MRLDRTFYRDRYDDAKGIDGAIRLYWHFLSRRRERHARPRDLIRSLEDRYGRLPPDFDAMTYLGMYGDLSGLFTQDWQGQAHYLEYGRSEGRSYRPEAPRAAMDGADRIALVLEGFDGSGKSSIAALLADALGGRVIRPFGGTLGGMMMWLAETDQHARLDDLAREAVAMGIARAPTGMPLVFDRHWVTAFHLLPEAFHGAWEPRPDTVICWADLHTTRARLRARGDGAGADAVSATQIDHYRAYAAQRGIPLIDTSDLTPQQAAARLVTMLAGQGLRAG